MKTPLVAAMMLLTLTGCAHQPEEFRDICTRNESLWRTPAAQRSLASRIQACQNESARRANRAMTAPYAPIVNLLLGAGSATLWEHNITNYHVGRHPGR